MKILSILEMLLAVLFLVIGLDGMLADMYMALAVIMFMQGLSIYQSVKK